jgi:predicted metalloprotease with PDZ domain
MSEAAPFADAAVANDIDDRSRTFISYYSDGEAIALALDLSLREVSGGRVSLDDYMARLWHDFGQVDGPAPGLVARPYSLRDLRDTLATVAGDRGFADTFFDRYIEGRDAADYAHLLGLAGYSLKRVAPGQAWAGNLMLQAEPQGLRVGIGPDGRGGLVPFGTPAYDAGIDSGDLIVAIDDGAAAQSTWAGLARRRPGERVKLTVERRDGMRVTVMLTLAENPALQIVPNEVLGGPVTPAQRAFRESWLGAKAR